MTRTLKQILDDVPEWCDDAWLDAAEEWAKNPTPDPPGGAGEFRKRLGEEIDRVQSARAVMRMLVAEWRSVQHDRPVYVAGIRALDGYQMDMNRAHLALMDIKQKVRAHVPKGGHTPHQGRTRHALRAIDLAMERIWRTEGDAQGLCMEVDKILEDFFHEREIEVQP